MASRKQSKRRYGKQSKGRDIGRVKLYNMLTAWYVDNHVSAMMSPVVVWVLSRFCSSRNKLGRHAMIGRDRARSSRANAVCATQIMFHDRSLIIAVQ